MTFARLAFGLFAFGAVIGIAAACDVGANDNSGALYGDASLISYTGNCPCEVGDSNKVYILACDTSACVTVDGGRTGFHCQTGGATPDLDVCNDAGAPCVPKTCADLGSQCAPNADGCGDVMFCGTCPTGEFCTQDLQNGEGPGVAPWACWPGADSVAVYGNFQGGEFAIDVDVDIPNLAIVVTSANTVDVSITGPFASDVLFVYYVGEARAAINGVTNTFVEQTRGTDGFLFCEEPNGANPDCIDSDSMNNYVYEALGAQTVLYNFCQSGPFSGTFLVSDQGSCL